MRTKPLALVLDDDELFRKMMEKVLVRLGCTARVASTVEEFLKMDSSIEPDIYLVDLNLGDGTAEQKGLELVEKLRGSYPLKPIIVISGAKDQTVVSHALEIGANDYLLKPFGRSLLAAKLGQVVRTEEISDAEKLLNIDSHSTHEGKVIFDTQVVSVDELGLNLKSNHLLPKGAVVRIGGKFIRELGGDADCLICVSSTAVAKDGGYDIYAEFESSNPEFLQSVRRWLAQNSMAKPA